MALIEFKNLPDQTTPLNADNLNNNFKEIFNLVYPIGSIYMSVNSINPSTLFGGTWQAWGTGRVPVGVDSSQTEFNSVEKTGGSKYLQSHSHNINTARTVSQDVSTDYVGVNRGSLSVVKTTETAGTGDSGNLQPYITCYMWKRTA